MLAFLFAVALAPWLHPLAFQPHTGWQTGASGTVDFVSHRNGHRIFVPESAAWTAKNVRYRSPATADPPNKTLVHLRANGIIIWAVISRTSGHAGQPIRLDMRRAKHYACCEGELVAGGEYELTGSAPSHAYFVIARIYVGSPLTPTLRRQAQHGLDRLLLPPPHYDT